MKWSFLGYSIDTENLRQHICLLCVISDKFLTICITYYVCIWLVYTLRAIRRVSMSQLPEQYRRFY